MFGLYDFSMFFVSILISVEAHKPDYMIKVLKTKKTQQKKRVEKSVNFRFTSHLHTEQKNKLKWATEDKIWRWFDSKGTEEKLVFIWLTLKGGKRVTKLMSFTKMTCFMET